MTGSWGHDGVAQQPGPRCVKQRQATYPLLPMARVDHERQVKARVEATSLQEFQDMYPLP